MLSRAPRYTQRAMTWGWRGMWHVACGMWQRVWIQIRTDIDTDPGDGTIRQTNSEVSWIGLVVGVAIATFGDWIEDGG